MVRERSERGRRVAVWTAGVIALAVVIVLAGCAEAGAGGGAGGAGGGSEDVEVEVAEALLTTFGDGAPSVVALSLYSEDLGEQNDVADGTDLVLISFFVESEGDEVSGTVPLSPTVDVGKASALVMTGLGQSGQTVYEGSEGSVDVSLPEFDPEDDSGDTPVVSVEGTATLTETSPGPSGSGPAIDISYEGTATIVSEDDFPEEDEL